METCGEEPKISRNRLGCQLHAMYPEADYRTGHIGRGLGPGSLGGPGKHGVK